MALITGINGLDILTTPSYANQEVESLVSSAPGVVEVISTTVDGITSYQLVPRSTGTAVITATLANGETASVTITVTQPGTTPSGNQQDYTNGEGSTDSGQTQTEVPVTGVRFHKNTNVDEDLLELTLPKNPTKLVDMSSYVTVYPNNASNNNWSLGSEDNNTVWAEGTLLCAKGITQDDGLEVTVTAGSGDNLHFDTLKVYVTAPDPEQLSWNTNELTVFSGNGRNLSDLMSFVPEDSRYSGKHVLVIQEGNSYVHLDGSVLWADAPGSARIRLKSTVDESIYDDLIVTVPGEGSGSGEEDAGNLRSFSITTDGVTRVNGNNEFFLRLEDFSPSDYNEDFGTFEVKCTKNGNASNLIQVVDDQQRDGFVLKASDVSSDELVSIYVVWMSNTYPAVFSNSISITVQPAGSPENGNTELISLEIRDWGLEGDYADIGAVIQAQVNYTPTGYIEQNYRRWSSGNTATATVDNNGLITCLRRGTVNITVEVDGKSASRILKIRDSSGGVDPSDWNVSEELTGTIVASEVVPSNSQDTFPTHLAKYGKGGYRSVSCEDEMNAISEERREEGMLVWVIADSMMYQYRDYEFIPVSFSGNGSIYIDPGDGSNPPGTNQNVDLTDIYARLEALEAKCRQVTEGSLSDRLNSSKFTASISNFYTTTTYVVGYNPGERTFTYSLNPPSNLSEYTTDAQSIITILEVRVNGQLRTGSWNGNVYSGTYTASPSYTSSGKQSWKVDILYKDSRWRDVDGDNLRTLTATVSKSITFGYRVFYGDTTLEPSEMTWANLSAGTYGKTDIISALPTESSPITFYANTQNLSALGVGRTWVAWPKSWASISQVDIIGPTGDSYAIDFEDGGIINVATTESSTAEYRLWYLRNASGVSGFKYRFFKR